MEVFPLRKDKDWKQFSEESDDFATKLIKKWKFDHLIAIERCGPARDGHFYSMRGRDLSHMCGLTEKLFSKGILRTAVGDGGNELGMGNVEELVKKHIPNGEKIACCVPSDNLIICGVSNWGGYALSAALFLLAGKDSSQVLLFSENLIYFLVI